MSKINTLVK